MFKQNRIILAGALALSMLVMGGCTLQPGSLLSLDKVTGTTAQAKSSLKVTVSRQGLQTQSIANLAIELRLELPYATDPAKRYQTLSVQDGESATFSDLPPENGTLTAVLTDVETNEVVDTQKQNIALRPGFETRAAFVFIQGGSAAVDVGVKVDTLRKDYRNLDLKDGYDDVFRMTWPNYWDKTFELQTDAGTQSVRFASVHHDDTNRNTITRMIGDQQWPGTDLGLDFETWYFIPEHAQYIETLQTFENFEKVRHFRWSNLFTIDGQDHEQTIDRWYDPNGLVKEVVSEGGMTLSTMVRITTVGSGV
ncbi:MAG TPA: hypothetical protein V6D05_04025 [Stenomitos sp.]